MFWLFLTQVLSADRACRETLRGFLGRLAREGQGASASTAGYCKARGRLRREELDQIQDRLARKIRRAHAGGGLWCGRPVKVVDGSSLSMPDTPSLQRVFPQPSGAKAGCGFPVMRVTALFCLGTGVLLSMARGSLALAERALFRTLWDLLKARDVVLADRGFCGYADLHFLRARAVDCVMRNHQRRTVGKRVLKTLAWGDRLILWYKSDARPDWVSKAAWIAMPATLTLREIEFQVAARGFRVESITVVTTLLDADAFPTQAFADLYRRRWQAELFLRDIKTTMGMDILRCKTPDMIHKELTLHLIAYNLVRLTMLEAAADHDRLVQSLSFKGALSTIRQWAPLIAGSTPRARRTLWSRLLEYVAADALPHRPNRVEPRARMRRPKNYQLLTQPRHLFKEIPHRNRYKKMLS